MGDLIANSNPLTCVFTREIIKSFNKKWDIPTAASFVVANLVGIDSAQQGDLQSVRTRYKTRRFGIELFGIGFQSLVNP